MDRLGLRTRMAVPAFSLVQLLPEDWGTRLFLAYWLAFGHFVAGCFTVGMVVSKGKFRSVPELWLLVAYWMPIVLGLGCLFTPLRNRSSAIEFLFGCVLAALVLAASFPIVGGARLALRKRRLARP